MSLLGGVQSGSHSTTESPKAGAGDAAGTGCYCLLYSKEVDVRGTTHTAGAGHRGNGCCRSLDLESHVRCSEPGLGDPAMLQKVETG